MDEELRSLLKYFESLVPQDDFTGQLDEAVTEARLHKEWRREYMKIEMMMRDSRKEGREEGRIEEKIDLVCRKLAKGKTPETIAEDLEEDLSKIQKICDIATKYAPDYDIEEILQEYLTNV